MSELNEVGKAFAGWAEENSGLAVDENFEYTDRTVGNFAAAAFAAGAQWQVQREPTDAEIEAAAKAMYWHYASYETDGTVDYKEAMKRYDEMLWEGIVRAGWAAARKAVTGDE